MEDPTCFVTLVHGTWARRPSWVQGNALFQTELRKRVGYDVQIRNFVWSEKTGKALALRRRTNSPHNSKGRHQKIRMLRTLSSGIVTAEASRSIRC